MDIFEKFDSLHNILPGRHFYQFYKGVQDYLQVMIPYFASGVQKKEVCVWFVSGKMGVRRILEAVERVHPQFKPALDAENLRILCAEDWFLTNAHFDGEKAFTRVGRLIDEIREKGYSVLRIAGDGGTIPRRDWQSLRAYECSVSDWIKDAPAVALCAFPIFECTPTQTRDVVSVHDDVLMGHI